MKQKFLSRTHPVVREVTITAPAQRVAGKTRRLQVTALPLPKSVPTLPRKGNKQPCLISNLIEPQVRAVETGEEVFRFDPPLILTVKFTNEDVAAARRCAVKLGLLSASATKPPPISLYTWWRVGKKIKWQKLAQSKVIWDASGKSGTLVARIKTLRPKDPCSDGCP